MVESLFSGEFLALLGAATAALAGIGSALGVGVAGEMAFRHDALHLFAGGLVYVGALVQHAGYRRDAHARFLGDIFNRINLHRRLLSGAGNAPGTDFGYREFIISRV